MGAINYDVLSTKIVDEDSALKVIRDCSYAFYFAVAYYVISGVIFSSPFWVNAIPVSILAFFLNKFKSRVAAVMLLVLYVIEMPIAIYASGIGVEHGVFLAFLLVYISVRSVKSTFRYAKYRKDRVNNE